MKIIIQILAITSPIIFAIILLVATFYLEKLPIPLELNLELFFVNIPIRLQEGNSIFPKLFFVVIAFGFAVFPIFRDYSSFFPTEINFEVYYDIPGIKYSVQAIEPISDNRFVFVENWQTERLKELQKLDEIIENNLPRYKKFFTQDTNGRYLYSNGNVKHKVEYKGFWQRYKTTVIEGFVTHILDLPDSDSIELLTKFTLSETRYNIVTPTFKDFIRCKLVVRPVVNQSLTSQGNSFYQTQLVVVTEIRFFPFVNFKRTLFCSETDKGLIPIAYALYFH